MAQFPEAIVEDVVSIEVADELVVQAADGHEIARLNKMTAAVWRRADGKTPVSEITRLLNEDLKPSVDNEAVWTALDRLADLGLVTERVTPPAMSRSLSRRGILRLGLVGGAVGAAAMPYQASYAQSGEYESKNRQEQDSKARRQEAQSKAQEQSGKQQRAQESASKRMQEEVNKTRQEQDSKRR